MTASASVPVAVTSFACRPAIYSLAVGSVVKDAKEAILVVRGCIGE